MWVLYYIYIAGFFSKIYVQVQHRQAAATKIWDLASCVSLQLANVGTMVLYRIFKGLEEKSSVFTSKISRFIIYTSSHSSLYF